LMEHKVLGREFKRGLEEGVQQGELAVIRRLRSERFGEVPAWADQRLANLSAAELEDFSVRGLRAEKIEDLLAEATPHGELLPSKVGPVRQRSTMKPLPIVGAAIFAAGLAAADLDPRVLKLIRPDARVISCIDVERHRHSVLGEFFPSHLDGYSDGVR